MRSVWVGVLVLSGCFFDPSEAGPVETDSTGATTDTTSSPTTSSASATTSAGEQDASSAQTSAVPGSTSSDTTDTTGSATETEDPDPPTSCLDRERGWQIDPVDLSALTGETPRGLSLAPDGLRLYYAAGAVDETVPHVAERFDRSSAFIGGQALAGWDGSGGAVSQPRLDEGATQLFARVDQRIHMAKFQRGEWSPSVEVALGLDDILSDPGLSANGLELAFIHRETLDRGAVSIWAPYVSGRANVDDEFGTPARLQIPSMTLDHAILCPVLSAEGDQVLFSGSFPATWETGVVGDLDVFVADREGTGWNRARRLQALSSADLQACPTSITEDGCEVSLRYFAEPDDPPTFALARME